MDDKKQMAEQEAKKPSLEDAFLQIESVIAQMEDTDISLDESFALYQQGIAQLKNCNELLDEVEKKMQILNADGSLSEM